MIYIEAFGISASAPDGSKTLLTMDLGEEIKAFTFGPSAARSVAFLLAVLTMAWSFSKAQG